MKASMNGASEHIGIIAMEYTIHEHQHRLAAWAASTAASASKLCRFKVHQGIAILEASGFNPSFSNPDRLPDSRNIDSKHEEWRTAIIETAKIKNLEFSHGIAAKLINCYLKVRFVCGGHHEHERVKSLHPPIDRLLLGRLAKIDFGKQSKQWRQFCLQGWSTYDSQTYENVIALIRQTLGIGNPLWKIEEHWEGHQ
jgi:hypothetical protein